MLNIHYKNGLTDTVTRDEYDDYTYDGKVVMIFKGGNMIALINVDYTFKDLMNFPYPACQFLV